MLLVQCRSIAADLRDSSAKNNVFTTAFLCYIISLEVRKMKLILFVFVYLFLTNKFAVENLPTKLDMEVFPR